MCVACIEYAKGTLNVNEFKSALREMTIEDDEHFEEVARILADYAGKPDEIRRELKKLADERR